jgi:hypothetical protein
MRLFSIFVLLLAAAISTPPAGDATESMLADLEAGLRNLEAEAFGIEEAPKALVDEVQRIREDAIYLRVKMRKHRAGRIARPAWLSLSSASRWTAAAIRSRPR